jgi:streptogramin lyase
MRTRALAILFALIFTISLCAIASASGDDTYAVREYPLPAGAGEIGAMAVDEAGNVWLIQDGPPALYKLVR